MSKAEDLRREAGEVRRKAFSANDHWQADWLEKLALLEDLIEENCEDEQKLLGALEDRPDFDDLLDDNRIEYERLVKTRDELMEKGWMS